MDTSYQNEIIAKIKNDEVNVIAYVNTPWQAKGVEAALTYLGEKICVKPAIILFEHGITGRCIGKEQFLDAFQKYPFYEIEAWDFKETTNKFQRFFERFLSIQSNRDKNAIYILNAGLINYRWITFVKKFCNKNVKYVLLDDGIGGYTGYEIGDPLSSPNSPRGKIYKTYLKRLKMADAFIDFRLLTRSKNGLIRNSAVGKYYRQVLNGNNGVYSSEEELSMFANSVVINTQPFLENDMIDANQDLDVLSKINEVVDSSCKVIVKPHPREEHLERYEKYGWEVYSKKTVSQEELFAKMREKPSCIVGIFSSTLLNMEVLFGIKTISLAKMFLKENLNAETRKCVQDFVDIFGGAIEMPETKEELEVLIRKSINV